MSEITAESAMVSLAIFKKLQVVMAYSGLLNRPNKSPEVKRGSWNLLHRLQVNTPANKHSKGSNG